MGKAILQNPAIAHKVMMVRPANFGFNEETAKNNSFQANIFGLTPEEISSRAVVEFDRLVQKLVDHGIHVEIIHDTIEPKNPDAVFPNNWISFHHPDFIVTYPMFAKARRSERRESIIDTIKSNYKIKAQYRFEQFENEEKYLEGTGSMIFDREHKIAYACRSVRTDANLFQQFCADMGFKPMLFDSVDAKGKPIYHTNVMMCLATDFVIICMESIPVAAERKLLKAFFRETGKKIIDISLNQVEQFAGNMIQLKNKEGDKYLIMSTSAYNSLNKEQLNNILPLTKIIHSDLTTIETYGGGSARCMIAELFLDEK